MTLQEIKNWTKTAKFIVTDYNKTDSNGNHYARDIFRKDEKYFSIEYINGKIVPLVAFYITEGKIVPKVKIAKERHYGLRLIRPNEAVKYK